MNGVSYSCVKKKSFFLRCFLLLHAKLLVHTTRSRPFPTNDVSTIFWVICTSYLWTWNVILLSITIIIVIITSIITARRTASLYFYMIFNVFLNKKFCWIKTIQMDKKCSSRQIHVLVSWCTLTYWRIFSKKISGFHVTAWHEKIFIWWRRVISNFYTRHLYFFKQYQPKYHFLALTSLQKSVFW